MLAGIGHNSGQDAGPGRSWRRHAWARARSDLLPRLPVEVVRLRVRRAAELGLPYRTYAGLRAASGHDLIGFLFSSNALELYRIGDRMTAERQARLEALQRARRVGLAQPPLTAETLLSQAPLDRADVAPRFSLSWSETREHLKAVVHRAGAPADRFVVIGETAIERDWAEAMQAAGYLSGARYFAPL